jgi:FkbM family methyltransferase
MAVQAPPVVRSLGAYFPRRPSRMNGPLLTMLMNGLQDRHGGQVFALQVGAGDGHGAPGLFERFRDYGWSGLLIEPHPRLFQALETLHVDSDRVAVLNLGLSDVAANLPLYALSAAAAERFPVAALNRASLSRDRLIGPGVTESDLESVEVPFLRLDVVLRELGIDTAQLLVVNAGGHEEQVLRGTDLAALDLSLVLVRSTPNTLAEAACIALLEAARLMPFRQGDFLVGLQPGTLAVPLEELLTFLGRRIDQPPEVSE